MRKRTANATPPPECRPASSRWPRARAVPGSPAGRLRPRADAWRTSGAGRADARRPAPDAARRPAAPTCAGAGARRRSRAGGPPWRGTARPTRRRRARAALGQIPLERAQRVLAGRHDPGPAALALHAHRLGVEVDRVQLERHELLGPQPAGVGELEQRPVAQLERVVAGIPSSRSATSAALSTRGRRAVAWARRAARPGSRAAPPAAPGPGTARAARPACAPRWLGASRARTGRRRSAAARGRRWWRDPAACAWPTGRTARRRSRRRARVFSATARRLRSASKASIAACQAGSRFATS